MKRIVSLLLAFAMLIGMLPMTAWATETDAISGTCGDNLTWELDEDGCLTVSGTGDMEDYCESWSEYKSQIFSVVIEDGVTSIGESAFSWCENIESVQIAGSVRQIGNSAFSDCESLTDLQIADGVESIGMEAFGGCDSLIFVEIPASVTDLNLYAFAYCNSLKAFAVAEKNSAYTNDEAGILYNKDMTALIKCPAGYDGVYTVPDGTESIGTWSFSACGKLTGVIIPDSVTEIGSYAFETCESLMEVRLSEGVTSIPAGTFLSSESLTYLTIPESVMEIGEMAFGHSGLTEVVFQGNAPVVDDYAFAYVTATAQYPCENETWTEDARQNYGGELAWRSYVSEAHVHTYTAVVTDPSCTVGGYTTYTCSCGDSYVDDYVVAAGHSYGDWYETKVATQEETGEEQRDCTACDHFETRPVEKVSGNVYASGTCGENLTWVLDDEGTLTISGTGDMWNYDDQNVSPWFEYRAQIKTVVITSGVTSVGNAAFSDFNGGYALSSVTVGDDVTSVGDYAFWCADCLTTVAIGNRVEHIGDYTFGFCTNLESIAISDTMISIGKGVFSHCDKLTEIVVGENNSYYSGDANGILFNKDQTVLIRVPGAFTGTYAIPNSVTEIGEDAFGNCDGLADVTIPDSVVSIGEGAFYSCDNLISVTIPEGVAGIGAIAFGECRSLISVVIPNSVASISRDTFSYCSSLSSVTIGSGVTSIATNAFAECNSLKDVYYEGTGEQWSKVSIESGNECLTNATIHFETGEPHTHAYTAEITVPTCTEQGYTTYTCSCGESYVGDKTEALNHTEIVDTAVAPTCTETGLTEGTHCAVCGEILTPQEVIPTSHSFVNDYCEYCGIIGGSFWMNLIWTLDDEGAMTISGDGVMVKDPANYGYACPYPWQAYRKKIKTVVLKAGVTNIGDNAFYECTSLTSISIPNSVTSIGNAAFAGCESLNNVTIPDGITNIGDSTFSRCKSLTSVTIPEGVTSFGESAFTYCNNLISVIIPDSVTNIGNNAFSYCTSLTDVTIPDGVISIGTHVFQGCSGLENITIPDGVNNIGNYTFSYCSSLTSITIPQSVTSIGYRAFYYCKSLNSITIGNGVITIGDEAFLYCTNLTSVTIPDSVTNIGSGAFNQCTSLTNVSIGNGVNSVGSKAFYGCEKLAKVTIGNGIASIGEDAFGGSYSSCDIHISDIAAWCRVIFSNHDSNPTCRYGNLILNGEVVTNLVIPEGITSIGDYAFLNCDSLVSVTIPNSVTRIGKEAFSFCENLASVNIPDCVTSIGDKAFNLCEKLTSITIPDSTVSIGNQAFYKCSNASSITIGSGVASIGDDAFSGCSSLLGIWVAENNAVYANDTFGVLHNKKMTTLLKAPGGMEGNYSVTNTVTSIYNDAFENCTELTSVTIPVSVNSIGDAAFSNCFGVTDVYYCGSEEQWADISIGKLNSYLLNATIHYNSRCPESSTSVRYFTSWDAEKQIAYFDGEMLLGCQVTEETDLSFLENVGSLVGQYVLAETRSRNDGMMAPDTLLSIKTVESKTGTVTAADDDTRTITIDGITYDVTMSRIIESANGNNPTEIITPSTFVDEFVLYHVYEDKVAGIEILKTLQGSLTGWNKETRQLSISKDDVTADSDWVSESYMLSNFADEDTEALLNSLSSGDTTIVTKIQFVCDGQGIVYSIMVINTPPESNEPVITGFASEVDGWSVINVRNSFGYAEDYHIPFSTYYVNGFSFSAAIKSIFNRRWGGSCFGLSLLAIAEYNGQGSLQEYFDREGDSLNEFGYQSVIDATYTSQTGNTFSGQIYTLAGNEEIIQTIERAQVSQCSSQIANAEVFKWDSDYSELLKYLSQDNPAPLIVTMVLGNSGHAVAIDTSEKPIDLGGGIYALMCYDSNSPQLTNKLDNGWTVYDYDQTFITLDTTNGHWCYYYNGETDGYRNYNFLQTRNIRFYDVTKLTSEFFYGKYSLDEDNVTNFFEASNLTVEANDSDDVLFEVSNSNPVLYALNAEYYPYCESVFSDSQNAKGYIMAPDGEYCFVNEDAASVVRISDSYIVAYEVDTDATVYFNDESTTFTIGNESDSTILNFKCAIQNVDGNVVVSAEGMLDNLSSITISADLDEQTATATTNSNLEAIDTLLEVGGEPQSQDFHVEDTSNEEHSYGTPEFVWEEDYTCTANFRCGHCANVQTTNCIVTSNSTTATETQAGKTVYTATVEFDDLTYTDTKTVTIPATGHVTHTAATEWISDGTNHWHKCTGCDEKLDVATHSGGTATCTNKAVCVVCGASYGELASHDYKTTWDQGDSNGHWHECKNCSAHDTQIKHTPGAAATETKAQTCTVCGYVITPALGHTCTAGSKWYSNGTYHWHLCTSCGAWVKTSYHSYSSDADETCNVCGYLRTVTATEPTEETESAVTEATKATVPDEEIIATETLPTIASTEASESLSDNAVSEDTDSNGVSGLLITVFAIVALGSLAALVILLVYKKRRKSE